MRTNEAWKSDDAFTRNNTMFGLVVIVYFCSIFMLRHLKITLYLIFIITFFFAQEFYFHKFLVQYTNEAKTILKQKKLLFQSFFNFGFSFYLGETTFQKLPEQLYKPGDTSFLSIYTKNCVYSLILFFVFLAIKQFCTALRIVSIYDIKRGVFGFWYRIIIILRTIYVSKYWLQFFTQKNDPNIIDEIINRKFDLAHFYLGGKALFMALLFWDLDNTRRAMSSYITKLYHKDKMNFDCKYCKKQNMPTVFLKKCGHGMCETCAYNKLKAFPFCPECKISPHDGPSFSYPDGYVSFPSIFACL